METTFERRLAQLKDAIMQHPHRDELLKLAHEQLVDGYAYTIYRSVGVLSVTLISFLVHYM